MLLLQFVIVLLKWSVSEYSVYGSLCKNDFIRRKFSEELILGQQFSEQMLSASKNHTG